MTLQADFTSQDYYRNPAAAIEKLRALGPVVHVRFPILGTVWATTTEALGAWQKAEIAKWWPMIKAANVKVE